jgi:hypothetical protein
MSLGRLSIATRERTAAARFKHHAEANRVMGAGWGDEVVDDDHDDDDSSVDPRGTSPGHTRVSTRTNTQKNEDVVEI